jgi:hypothetical protein
MNARDELSRILAGIRAVAMCNAVVPEKLKPDFQVCPDHPDSCFLATFKRPRGVNYETGVKCNVCSWTWTP